MKYNRYDANRSNKYLLVMNDYENLMLREKSKKCGINRSEFLRKLICGYCPSAAPDERFYKKYDSVRSTLERCWEILKESESESYISREDVAKLARIMDEIFQTMLDIKILVLEAKMLNNKYFEECIFNEGGN